jgi:hypothetical protein
MEVINVYLCERMKVSFQEQNLDISWYSIQFPGWKINVGDSSLGDILDELSCFRVYIVGIFHVILTRLCLGINCD